MPVLRANPAPLRTISISRIVNAEIKRSPSQPASIPASPLTTASPLGTTPIASIPHATAAIPIAPQSLAKAYVPAPGSGSSSAPPPPPPSGKAKSRLRMFARTVLVGVLGGVGYVVYASYTQRHPSDQLDFDATLPTVAVLGNGWASTAFLKQLDNEGYNVVVISPRNYFLFTPLLPSVTVGTLAARSVIEPTRFLTRHLKRKVEVYEGEVTSVDVEGKVLRFIGAPTCSISPSIYADNFDLADNSEIKGEVSATELKYDYLVYAVGAENQTFGIQGVKENACFLKELGDAEKIRSRLMDCQSYRAVSRDHGLIPRGSRYRDCYVRRTKSIRD